MKMSAKAAARRGRRFAALNATRLMTTHRQRLSILKNRRAISCDAREKEARSTRALRLIPHCAPIASADRTRLRTLRAGAPDEKREMFFDACYIESSIRLGCLLK